MTGVTLGWSVYAALVVVTVVVVAFVDAPYGRHDRQGWGPRIGVRAGWLLMESPSVVIPVAAWIGAEDLDSTARGLLALWLLHYGYRGLVYPWLLATKGRTMPVLVPMLGFSFNVLNAGLNVHWVVHASWPGARWLQPLAMLGIGLFFAGFVTHVRSDAILRGLRRVSNGYGVPHGFLYRWVSCPNYLGEMVQWWGWALLTASPPGLLFALYTMANLGPRALAHHRWYRETFEDYPRRRRALIPGIL